MTPAEMMAAGHRYSAKLGTGIEWKDTGTAQLYQGGQVIATGTHATASAHEFWLTLAFRETFPQVTHWWFGSAWTGRVRVSPPAGDVDDYTRFGSMQFVDEEAQSLVWTLTDDFRVAPPMPQFHVTPVNLPLRRQLAEMVLAPVIQQLLACGDDQVRAAQMLDDIFIDVDVIQPNQWVGVTSLVERDRLEEMFSLRSLWWTLDPLGVSMRQALCQVQALPAPVAV
jgi:hypothetical protein